LKFIYSFTENSAIAVALGVLGGDYKKVIIRKGKNATKAKFLKALKAAATTTGVKAVDVFLQLHGDDKQFIFDDGSVDASDLRDEILKLKLPPGRLRLLYNTTCYGDSQNSPYMINAGFATTIGSHAINCTGATEFPTFCSLWQIGKKVVDIMAVADDPGTRAIQDAAAKAFSPAAFSNANSKKYIQGNKNLTIS